MPHIRQIELHSKALCYADNLSLCTSTHRGCKWSCQARSHHLLAHQLQCIERPHSGTSSHQLRHCSNWHRNHPPRFRVCMPHIRQIELHSKALCYADNLSLCTSTHRGCKWSCQARSHHLLAHQLQCNERPHSGTSSYQLRHCSNWHRNHPPQLQVCMPHIRQLELHSKTLCHHDKHNLSVCIPSAWHSNCMWSR